MSSMTPGRVFELSLDTGLHTKYWLRCLKTFLPTGYQEQDSSRIVLGFFILFSLDILNGIDKHVTTEERQDFISFIYHCQHPEGGFRSFPGTDFGQERKNEKNARWDPANIAGTYFALVSLLILGDDLSKVNREATLAWVRHLQCDDGSFGETAAGSHGIVNGGQDVRFCMLAALICSILGEETNSKQNIGRYVNADELLRFILASQSYDGGFARKPYCESHAGSTYCAVATLRLLGQTTTIDSTNSKVPAKVVHDLTHWLSHRQTTMLQDYQDLTIPSDAGDGSIAHGTAAMSGTETDSQSFAVLNATPALPPQFLDFELAESNQEPRTAGLNGRVNKPADTCYSFWAGASLDVSLFPSKP